MTKMILQTGKTYLSEDCKKVTLLQSTTLHATSLPFKDSWRAFFGDDGRLYTATGKHILTIEECANHAPAADLLHEYHKPAKK